MSQHTRYLRYTLYYTLLSTPPHCRIHQLETSLLHSKSSVLFLLSPKEKKLLNVLGLISLEKQNALIRTTIQPETLQFYKVKTIFPFFVCVQTWEMSLRSVKQTQRAALNKLIIAKIKHHYNPKCTNFTQGISNQH